MFHFQREIYLDSNATTDVTKNVRKRIERVLKHHYGNPSSLYRIARDAASVLADARAIVAQTINAEPESIFFTGSATEANNTILKMLSEVHQPQKNKIIATPIEHPSVMHSLEYLKTKSIKVEYLPVDAEGRVVLDVLDNMIDADTFLVCCIYANNEIGTIQDLKRITAIAKRRGVLVMSDCVQALGKISVDVEDLGIDYATLSAHKVHGPKGVGALFVRSDAPFQPLLHGGHQEANRRAGTEGLHDIAGFGEACRAIPDALTGMDETAEHKEMLIRELRRIKPDLTVHSPVESCLPNTASIRFPDVNNAVMMAVLDLYGVAVSAGSACNASEDTPSHVLSAIGLSDEQARETIRFSLSEKTSVRDIRYVVKIIQNFLEGKTPSIRILRPSQVDRDFLFDEGNYLLDIRFWYERKMLKSLPNSYEASFISFKKYIHHIPKDKNIIVICMGGVDATAIAYLLKSKGYRSVSFMLLGVAGWRVHQPGLYKKYAGKNVTKLAPRVSS
jgi:cysteine desulfurase